MQCPQRKNKSIKGRVEAVNILRDTLWNQTVGMRKQVLTLVLTGWAILYNHSIP